MRTIILVTVDEVEQKLEIAAGIALARFGRILVKI